MPFIIESWHLPYIEQLQPRGRETVELVVVHCTELPDLATAREYGERVLYTDSRTGNSGHFYIDRDGRVLEFVPVDRIANHTRGYNPRSIGIELINLGRYPDWFHSQHQQMTEPYTQAQIDALRTLLAKLRAELPRLSQIAGHEDLDTSEVAASDDASLNVRRKRDPGDLFPWSEVQSDSALKRIPESAATASP